MKSRNILILALVMGLITTIMFNKYLKDLDKKYKRKENKISVIVLKESVKRNQKVTKEMLTSKEFEENSVHPDAVKRVEDIEGKLALTDMRGGEVLFSDRFGDQSSEKELLTRKINNGFRAVSIEVNLVESVSNLIQPEDYVDVVFSEKQKTDEKEELMTQILLENVRVLAVGKRLVESTGSSDAAAKENQVEYSSITLELTPEDAVRLINSDEKGNIKFTVRSKIAS